MRAAKIEVAAEARSRAVPSRRPLLTRAARRDIRRAGALANEMQMHSFRVHVDGTVTWTLRHEISKESVPAKLDESKAEDSKHELSLRKQRSAQRASAHRALMSRAQNFYAQLLIWRWARASSVPSAEAMATTPRKEKEHEGAADGATKRRAPFAAAASPSAPAHRDKREHVLPPNQPPPSIPPSPPGSPSPSTPPIPSGPPSPSTSSPPNVAPRAARSSPRSRACDAGSVAPLSMCRPQLAEQMPDGDRPPCDGCGAPPFIVANGRGLCRPCAVSIMRADT